MTLRESISNVAKTWVGTPNRHYQCCKGVAVDCAHLVLGVGKELGLFPKDYGIPYYSPQWYFVDTEREFLINQAVNAGCREKPISQMMFGDILMFLNEKMKKYNHVGVYVPKNNIVHTYPSLSLPAVTEHRIIPGFIKATTRCYAFPGVNDAYDQTEIQVF